MPPSKPKAVLAHPCRTTVRHFYRSGVFRPATKLVESWQLIAKKGAYCARHRGPEVKRRQITLLVRFVRPVRGLQLWIVWKLLQDLIGSPPDGDLIDFGHCAVLASGRALQRLSRL